MLSYTVGARSLADASSSEYGIRMTSGAPLAHEKTKSSPITGGILCEFELTNNGTYSGSSKGHAQVRSEHLEWDIFRLKADIKGAGWKAALPNAVIALRHGQAAKAYVAVRADIHAKDAVGVVKLTATSESDPTVRATSFCIIDKHRVVERLVLN